MDKLLELNHSTTIEFDYINWKGLKGKRTVKILGFYYGSTDYHKESQWLLRAIDLYKGEERIFAMRDMSNLTIG